MATETKPRMLIGHTTEAYGADPSDVDKTYSFRYKVLDVDDLIPSHTDALAVNPNYPKELQPRIRERAASRMQIDTMAANLNPKVLLRDTGFLDTGPMIVGTDDVVESGNGRVLALRKAIQDHPEKYRLYRTMLVNQAETYGLKDDDIERIKHPVLVRERITRVDRAKFAAEANTSNVLAMSPFEQAVQDSGRLPASTIQTLEVGEDESIDQALRRRANGPIVAKFYQSIPANERASIVDNKGEITASGLNRLKLAIFTKTYQGEAGQRLARTFSESLDPNIKNMESAMFQSLPDMAKAESLVATGAREKDLSIAPDMAEVIDTYAALKQKGLSVDQYLAQQAMFEDVLNPMQRQILEHLDSIARQPKKIREFLRDNASRIETAPTKGQGGMFGESFDVTKERLVNASINKQRAESGKEPIEVAFGATSRKGLEKPDTGRGKGTEGIPGQRETDSAIQEIALAPSTSVQTGLSGFGKEAAQVQMFGEVSGKESKRETLVDVEKLKAVEANKPLPGQIEMAEAKEQPPPPETDYARRRREFIEAKKAGEPATSDEIQKAQSERTPQAQAMDNAQQHSIVVSKASPKTKQWLKDHGSMDIMGIDTKVTYQRGNIRIVEAGEEALTLRRKPKPFTGLKERAKPRVKDLGGDIVQEGGRRHLRRY